MSISAGENRVITETLLDDIAATERLATEIASCSERGDVIALFGDLGSGKTTFARFFIRALGITGEVPSPTFMLAQLYQTEGPTIWHFDFYRISKSDEAFELGMEEAFKDGISLIEWPERISGRLPLERLDVELDFVSGSENSRSVRLRGDDRWRARLKKVGTTNRPS
tara:strand:+ start:1055 stop:1558 length:504 start_codon:yes stop_codon:yes gene_type:complete